MPAKETDIPEYQQDIFQYMLKTGIEYLATINDYNKQLDGLTFIGITELNQDNFLRRLFPRSCSQGGYLVSVHRFGLLARGEGLDTDTTFLVRFAKDKGIIQSRNTNYYLESCVVCGDIVYWEEDPQSNIRLDVTKSLQEYNLRKRELSMLFERIYRNMVTRTSIGGFDW